MLSFNPDEYRQRLNLALGIRDTSSIGVNARTAAPAKIENPYDTEEAQQQQPQKKPKEDGGGMNLGGMLQGVMGAMGGGGGAAGGGGGGDAGGGMPNLGGMIPAIGGMMGGAQKGQGQGGKGSAGGLPNLEDVSSGDGGGNEMGDWVGTPSNPPGLNPTGVIDESGAMGGARQPSSAPKFNLPTNQDGKIATRPPDLEEDIDPAKLDKAKTIDDVFDAASPATQNKYMKWWEDSYGSINGKYDAMRKQLGEHKDLPEKPSKKQMFLLLLGYGTRMANNMRVGREGGSSDIDPMAASQDAYGYGRDMAMGNRMSKEEHAGNLGAIEDARSKELKTIGTKGEAMDKASEIAYRDAQRENLGKSEGNRFTAADGLVYMIEGEKAKPVMGPNGKQLRGQLTEKAGANSEFERAKASYLEAHGYDDKGKKLTGAAWKKVEQAANDFARYGSRQKDGPGTNLDDLRAQAKDRVNTIMRSSPDTFRGLEPDELNQKLGELEDVEYERLKRANLGSSPVHDGPRARAPERSEKYLRAHPEALEDFVTDYGYVPEGMEQHVTPAIKQRLGL